MNLIYFGMIMLVLSTATKIAAEDGDIPDDNDDDMPEELKKLLVKNSTLGESLIKIIKMGKDFSSDIWSQPISKGAWKKIKNNTHYSISIKLLLIKARNITKTARNSSETLNRLLRWIDVALDDVKKVINGIMAIQSKASKIENLLYWLKQIEYSLPDEYQEGRVWSVGVIYYDIEYRLYLMLPGQGTFRWFNTVLGQIEDYTYKWLDLYFPMVRGTKGIWRLTRKRIRYLQDIAPRFHENFGPDVNALAERLKQKIDKLEKVTRKKLKRARGDE